MCSTPSGKMDTVDGHAQQNKQNNHRPFEQPLSLGQVLPLIRMEQKWSDEC